MNKKTLIAVTCCLAFSLSMPIRVNAGAFPPALATADWSVNAAHNLASNPPPLEAVKEFQNRFQGLGEEEAKEFGDEVCEFRFADLRGSGNLSLITAVNPGGRQWPKCNELQIFDKTPRGFELYSANRAYGHDLADSVLDINHDGRHELVLWGALAPVAAGPFNRKGLECDAQWPLIFAWTGNGYSEVGDQYKDYYQSYLKSLDAQLAAYSSESGAASAQTANPAPVVSGAAEQTPMKTSQFAIGRQPQAEISSGPGGEPLDARKWSLPQIAAPTPTPETTLNLTQQNYPCARIEAAKTEAFLGIDSDSTMSAAVKDSESADPNKRILAAVIFSYLGTQEAEQNLKTLSNDADSRVAAITKRAASFGEDPGPGTRTIPRYSDRYVNLSAPPQSRP